jgi:hypothetical protein
MNHKGNSMKPTNQQPVSAKANKSISSSFQSPPQPIDWPAIMQEWEVSGIPQHEFCQSRSLVYGQFMYHRNRLNQSKKKSPALLPVKLHPEDTAASRPATHGFILHWPNGTRLSIPPGADAVTLKTLLNYLEKP